MVFRQCRVPLNESHLSSPTLLRRKELRASSRHELGDKPLSCGFEANDDLVDRVLGHGREIDWPRRRQ